VTNGGTLHRCDSESHCQSHMHVARPASSRGVAAPCWKTEELSVDEREQQRHRGGSKPGWIPVWVTWSPPRRGLRLPTRSTQEYPFVPKCRRITLEMLHSR
jgi:hypothetical protein